jgi:uncharacterized membrane protein YczE
MGQIGIRLNRLLTIRNTLLFFSLMVGLFLFAAGIALMIIANWGAAPWDVLHVGLVYTVGLTVGTWSQILGFMLIVFTALITRKVPGFACFLNMFFIGFFVDLILQSGWVQTPEETWISIGYFLLGIVLVGFGSGMYIAPGWGAGPRDGFMLALSLLVHRSIRSVRTGMEITVLSLGWLLGGPVHLGTLTFCLTIGPICQFFIQVWKRILGETEGRERNENFHEGSLRIDNHDGISRTLR